MLNRIPLFSFLVQLLLPAIVDAQQYDKTWVLGTPMASMTFDGDSIHNDSLQNTNIISFITIGDICDSAGHLQFFTNGINVSNEDKLIWSGKLQIER